MQSRIAPAPIIGLALAHIAGAAIAHQYTIQQAALLQCGLLLVLLALLVRHKICPAHFVFPAWLCAAWCWSLLALQNPSALELGNQMDREREHLHIIGEIIAEPYKQLYVGQEEPLTYLPLKISAVQRTLDWQTTSGRLLVVIDSARADVAVKYGDRIQLNGVVRQKSGPSFGLKKSKYRMHTELDNVHVLSSDQGNWFLTTCFNARAHLAQILEYNMDEHPEEANIMKALLLGYRSELDPEINQQFAQTGVLHVFAISGLHIGILCSFIIVLLKLVGVPKMHWIYFLAPILIVFVATTGMKASAMRAGLMAALYFGAPALRRQPNVITAMALAAIVVLLIAPEQVADAGFLFSFIIVAGMIALIPTMTELFTGRLKPDEWAPDRPSDQPGRLRRFGIYFGSYCAVSTSAWLTSMPLTAYFFNLFSPVALIGNIFAVFGAYLIVLFGMLSLIFGSIWLPLAGLFNTIDQILISLLLNIIGYLNDFPHAWQHVAAPPLWTVISYMILLGWIAGRRKIDRYAIAIVSCSAVAWFTHLHFKNQEAYLDVFDAAPGQAFYLKTPGSHGYLIDTGGSFHARSITSTLHSKGLDRLDGIILTHGDINHVANAPLFAETFQPDHLFMPDQWGSSKRVTEVIEALSELNIPTTQLRRGDKGLLADTVHYNTLNPPPNSTFKSADDLSLILHLSYDQTAILITGGMGLRAEFDLFESRLDPGATVLITPNTSGWDSLSTATINLVRPEAAIVAGSSFNMTQGRINRLREARIDVFRVDDFGPVRVDLKTGETRFLEQD